MRIERRTVEDVAKLARLALSEEEIERFTGQLSAILDAVSKLNAVDTSGVGPTASILDLQDVLRDDEPRPSLDKEDALRNAPEREGDYFRVQPVFE
jgi:aspartyl-tRNA(Asn)/glutamyl-tRNA(Gln) amidotransferase subunit C